MALEQIKRIDESLSSVLESYMKPGIINRIVHDPFWLVMIQIFQIINKKHQIKYTEITNLKQQAYNMALREKCWTWEVKHIQRNTTAYIKLNKIIHVFRTDFEVLSAGCVMSKSQDFPDGSTDEMTSFEPVITCYEPSETIPQSCQERISDQFNNNPIWESTATRAQAPLSEQPIPTPKISD